MAAGFALVLLLMMALPGVSSGSARARGAACSSAASHRARESRACRRAQRKGERARHRRRTSRGGRHPGKGAPVSPGPPAGGARPVCEDGSAPVQAGASLTCAGGGEPVCESGMAPTVGATGAVCPSNPAESEGEPQCAAGASCASGGPSEIGEAPCEGGGGALQGPDGSYECADGSEPRCPAGSTLVLSAATDTLYCEPLPFAGVEES